MQAARLYGTHDIRVEEIAPPARLDDGQVRINVLAAGICGSDLHNYRTGKWLSRVPVTPGHELFGEVMEAAPDVHQFRPGERVVADSRVWCGGCPACQRQDFNLCTSLGFVGEVCDGGFAGQAILPARSLLKIPDDVPSGIAVLSEPLGVALRVVNQLKAPPGALVRVAGGGTIGGLAALLLHEVAHCRVQLAEPNRERYQKLNALIPLEPDGAFSFAVEATGINSVLGQLVSDIAGGGRIVLVGLFHHSDAFDFNALVEREITLVGSSVFRDEQRQALALMPRLAPKLTTLLSPATALAEIPAVYASLIAGQSPYLKTVIKP